MSDATSDDSAAELLGDALDDTGSHAIDRALQRELVRAALFDGSPAPRVGRFLIEERLGAGASSVVYAAWDEVLARRVAVKIFVAESSATRSQVLREARALAQLSHHNVVAVFDVGEWRDHAFIAMELVAGITLSRWQADAGRKTSEILDAYAQAGRGLAAAHRAGLVHRDFKPANVMVDPDGRVVVTDFGLVSSIALDSAESQSGGATAPFATGTRSLIGTPAYVAPEQRRGATPRPSADIYSFSLCLCEALIGWHPMLPAKRGWERVLARRVPQRIHAAIRAGLADDPEARGASIEPLVAVLEPGPRSVRQRTRLAVAGLAIAGLAIAGLAIALVIRDPRGPDRAPGAPVAHPAAQFVAPPHRTLADQIAAVIAAPPRRDDAGAAGELRALILQPLPTERRCAWPGSIASAAIGDDFVAGVDDRGDVYTCALDSGAISLVTAGAHCVFVGESAMLGVSDPAGRVRVIRRGDHGWQSVATTGPVPAITGSVAPHTPCPLVMFPERDGAVSIAVIGHLARDPAGRVAAMVTRESEISVVDLARNQVVVSAPVPGSSITGMIDVSRDGTRALAVTAHGPILWWEAGTARWRQETMHFDSPNVISARLSPSGAQILLVDLRGELEIRSLGGGRTAWLTSGPVVDAAFHGEDIVIAIDADARIWRWDLASQRSGLVATPDNVVWSVASNAEIVVSGSEGGMVMAIDRRRGAVQLQRDGGDVYKVALDGDRLVAGGNDGLRMWNWRDGRSLPLAAGGLRVWDVESITTAGGARVHVTGTMPPAALMLWRGTSRQRIWRSRYPSERVNDVAVSPDGRLAAAVTSTGRLVVLDIAAERVVADVQAHVPWARRVVFDPATSAIVTTGDDGYVSAWSVDGTRRWTLRVGGGKVYDLDVHAGRAISASDDGGIALIDLASGQIVRRLPGHVVAAKTARFRADGQWFVTGDDAGRVCLWRSDSTQCHTWLDGHTKAVVTAAFADDGTIFTGAHDGTVRFWRPTYDAPVDEILVELARYGARP